MQFETKNKSSHLLHEARYLSKPKFSKLASINSFDTDDLDLYSDEPSSSLLKKCIKRSSSLDSSLPLVSSISTCDEPDMVSFSRILFSRQFLTDEKLARTFFHLIVKELEQAHRQGKRCSTITLDNLYVLNKTSVRITEDSAISVNSLEDHQAPEMKVSRTFDTQSAVIYSLSLFLFVLKTGYMPFTLNKQVAGYDFRNLLNQNPEKFWVLFNSVSLNLYEFSSELRELISSMVRADPMKRATFEDIKSSKWYGKDVYSTEELEDLVAGILD